jgi:hypothetical protein
MVQEIIELVIVDGKGSLPGDPCSKGKTTSSIRLGTKRIGVHKDPFSSIFLPAASHLIPGFQMPKFPDSQ